MQGVRQILDRQSGSRKVLAHRAQHLKDQLLANKFRVRQLRQQEQDYNCRLRAKEKQLSLEQNKLVAQEDALMESVRFNTN